MSDTSLSYVTLQDGTGTATTSGQQFKVRAEYSPQALSYALHMVPEIGGAAWGLSNPAPMSLVINGAVVGGPGAPLNVSFSAPTVTDESGSNQLLTDVIPSPNVNGAPIGALPSWAKSVRFYVAPSDSVTFIVGRAQPLSAPPATVTISGNQTSGTGPNWDEPLAPGQTIYVTSYTGSPKFRFMS